MNQDLGKLLLENEQITPEQLKQAEKEAQKTGKPASTMLLNFGLVNEDIIKTVLELHYAVNYLNLKKIRPDLELISLIPWELIVENGLMPVTVEENRLTLAMLDPTDNESLTKLRALIPDLQIYPVVCSDDAYYDFLTGAIPKEIAFFTERNQLKTPKEAVASSDPVTSFETDDISDSELISIGEEPEKAGAQDAPITRICNHIVSNAIARGCTNIHIEPVERQILVHYRKEGVLFSARKLPKTILPDLINKFKKISSADNKQKDLPYDGRLSIRQDGQIHYFRLSIVPGAYGEHMIIWLE